MVWKFRDTLCALDVDSGIVESDKAYAGVAVSTIPRTGRRPFPSLLSFVNRFNEFEAILLPGLETIKNATGVRLEPPEVMREQFVLLSCNKVAAQTRSLRSIFMHFPAYFQKTFCTGCGPFSGKRIATDIPQRKTWRSDEFEVGNVVTREFLKSATTETPINGLTF